MISFDLCHFLQSLNFFFVLRIFFFLSNVIKWNAWQLLGSICYLLSFATFTVFACDRLFLVCLFIKLFNQSSWVFVIMAQMYQWAVKESMFLQFIMNNLRIHIRIVYSMWWMNESSLRQVKEYKNSSASVSLSSSLIRYPQSKNKLSFTSHE